MKEFRINPQYNLKPYINGGELVAFNIGYSGEILVLVAKKALDYEEEKGNGIFPKTKPSKLQSYDVFKGRMGQFELICSINNEKFNIHDIQALPEGKLLLVCVRSHYKSEGKSEKNGRIYSSSGEYLNEILLGDGIESTQVTSNGVIWTSFFDEGIFGNYGWNDPIGSSGLVSRNIIGEILYEYSPIDSLGGIHDCYSLNVSSDVTWCYYYSDFPLVKIKNNKIVDYWEIPILGSHAFAVDKNYALFRGGYNNESTYVFFELRDKHTAIEISKFNLLNEDGLDFDKPWVIARNDQLYILSNNKIYTFSIRDAFVENQG